MESNVIRTWLEEKGRSQEDLAREVGVSTGTIQNIVNGHHTKIKIDLLDRLATVTGMPMEKIVCSLLEKHKNGG